MSFVGVPYKWGGENPISGMDCSGFVSECLEAFGLIRSRNTAQGIYDEIKGVSQTSFEAGAVVFYGTNTFSITHVGILIVDGMTDGIMLEAGGGGAKTVSKEEADLTNAFVRIRPILRRKGLLTALFPNALR